jgi:hypothetical protein
VDELVPKLSGRSSGYFKVKRTDLRRGDNTQMATISFVDDLTVKPSTSVQPKKESTKKPVAKTKKTESNT